MLPTTPAKATHDYERNGTLDLFAALEIAARRRARRGFTLVPPEGDALSGELPPNGTAPA